MADTRFCIQCSKTIGIWDKSCKYCGTNQFGENNEFYPDEKSMGKARAIIQSQTTVDTGFFERFFRKKQKQPMFSEEESFLYGIHPNDEIYRKTMELDVLSKNYK